MSVMNYTITELMNQEYANNKERALVEHILELELYVRLLLDRINDYYCEVPTTCNLEKIFNKLTDEITKGYLSSQIDKLEKSDVFFKTDLKDAIKDLEELI